jgi:cytochrome b pre-mRNA-processing protein 3
MFKFRSENKQELLLYNKILELSRNKLLYTKIGIKDTFQNRIHLIFIHVCFLFIKTKHENSKKIYKEFYQKTFDLIFNKIEVDMREIGFGDTTVNKNMKHLIKNFYNILIKCENYKNKDFKKKHIFFSEYLVIENDNKTHNYQGLINYFDKFYMFCLDLSSDNVLKGDLNFNYK